MDSLSQGLPRRKKKKKKSKLDSFPASYQFFVLFLASPNPGEDHTQKPITRASRTFLCDREITTTLPRTGFMRAGYCLCPHGN